MTDLVIQFKAPLKHPDYHIRYQTNSVVEFEGLECAFASFLSSVGSLGVYLEVYTSRLVGCLLGELDNQLHRL